MALDMQAKMAEYRERAASAWSCASASAPGPVVAGVIGKKKFIYDMWGDT
jgi:hypothetical protein